MHRTILYFFLLLFTLVHIEAKTHTIAVLATSGKEEATHLWQPMITYLNQEIRGEHFILLPIELQEIDKLKRAIAKQSIDFLITQPAVYVDLEYKMGIVRLLTLMHEDGTTTQGSVIIAHSKSSINTLDEIDSHSIAAVSPHALGGWLIAFEEFLNHHINLSDSTYNVNFLYSSRKVVESIENGTMDIGIIDTGVLEELSEHYQLDFTHFKILNKQTIENYPYFVSTKLYPELVFAQAHHVETFLAKKVSLALLSMNQTNAAVHKNINWTLPKDYGSVHALLKRLQIEPYDHVKKTTINEFIKHNRMLVILLVIFMTMLLISILLIFMKSLSLSNTKKLLGESLEYFKTIFNSTNSMHIVTEKGVLIHANKKFLDFYNCTSVEECNVRYPDLITTFDAVNDENYINNDTLKEVWVERVYLSPKKHYKVSIKGQHFTLKVHQVLDKERKQFLITFSDITQVIQEKYRLASEVDTASNTIKFQQEQLKSQAQKAAMGEMISIIAHQLKQPLSAISAMTTNIKIKNELDILTLDLCLEINEKITNDVAFMTTTIDDFRHFFNPKKVPASFALIKTIEDVLALLGPLLDKNNIAIDYHIDQDIIINSFASELKQVIMNIVNNAKDIFLEKDIKKPLVTIEAKEENQHCILSISDNAGGIPVDILPKIFTPYFTTKGTEGTGLGLHMTKMIIEDSLQGEIHAKNSDKGAVFEIIIPLKVEKREKKEKN